MSNHTHKEVFTIVPRNDGSIGPDGKRKGYFIKIGAAFVNQDVAQAAPLATCRKALETLTDSKREAAA